MELDLTECDILLDALKAWEHKDASIGIITSMTDMLVRDRNDKDAVDFKERQRKEKEKREMEQAQREEQSTMLRAKIITYKRERQSKMLDAHVKAAAA